MVYSILILTISNLRTIPTLISCNPNQLRPDQLQPDHFPPKLVVNFAMIFNFARRHFCTNRHFCIASFLNMSSIVQKMKLL